MNIKLTPIESKDLIGFEMDVRGEIHKQVASLQDQIVTQQLEKAGWLSPKATAELRAQVEALSKRLDREETSHEITLEDRDRYHEMADLLAMAIGKHFGADIGEHSSANRPWENALEVIHGARAAEAQPVYLVATGEVHEGLETYTRHDAPVPMADQEMLFTHPAPQPSLTRPAVPEGWKLAPVEPTDLMVQSAHHLDLSYMPGQDGADRAAIYRAMLAAAPQPEVSAPVPPDADLVERCREIMEWKKTGLLKGEALRRYAAEYGSGYDALLQVEGKTVNEALAWVAAQSPEQKGCA